MRAKIVIIAALLLTVLGVNAQTTVTGTVLDGAMQGEPLIGAVVKVPDTSTGTVTDLDGHFTLQLPTGKTQLQVSMVGYKTQVANVAGKSDITITLQEDDKALDEVVVIGYGTMKKRDLSGAMSQIKSDELLKGGATDAAQALQGKVAGVQVNQSDGAPGASVSVKVRGANSFTTSSQPLYIVDGVPYGTGGSAPAGDNDNGVQGSQYSSPLSMINPNDIEKVEVLKDASATAIYGSRGANGVVIITTKRGSKGDGKARVELNAKFGLSTVAKRVKMLDAYTYAKYQNEAATNSNYYEGSSTRLPYRGEWGYPYVGSGYLHTSGDYNPAPEDFLTPGIRTDEYGNSTVVSGADWQDEIYHTGVSQDYGINVSGGSDSGWYSFSGNYTKQHGVIRNTGYERYGLSMNIGRHVFKWLELGTSQHFTDATTDFQRTNSENTGVIRSALIFPPTYGPDASTEQLDELNWLAANPLEYINGAKDQLHQISWFSSSYAEVIFTPWLKFRQNLGLGYNDGHRDSYFNRHTQEGKSPTNGRAYKATNTWKSLTAESILTFDKTWGIHKLNAVAGLTFESGKGENTAMRATNFPTDLTKDIDMSLALDRATLESGKTKQNLESFLWRVNYTLKDRYLFTASMRTDGSSSFAKDNKWATFFSGAVAWRLSEEKFIKALNIFYNLKIRASFGQTGNQAIGAYRTLTALQAANYPYNGTLESGLSTIDWRGPTNPDLKWETTDQWNLGIDMAFLNNRLQFTADYYFKKTRDLLQNVTIPHSSGYGQMLVNRGNVKNEGLELTLSYDVLTSTPVKWNFQANMSFNKNWIGGLDGDQYAQSLWSAANQAFLQRNGCPIGTLYGYVEDGFYNNVAAVKADPQYRNLSDAEALRYVGEIRYRDIDGDGKITEKDRTIIGDTNPDFIYGFTSNLSWKNFSLSFMLQGSQGNDILNYNLWDIKLGNIGNITRDAYNSRWTPENADHAKWPKPTAGYLRSWRLSNRYVEDGSYLRMKYITLSYNWARPFKNIGIDHINFSFTANNVFTITNYSWMDPDVNAGGNNAATPGVDSYSYPSARSFVLGMNVVF